MTIHRLEITLNDELWDALNAARGHEPRAAFVKRALAAELADEPIRDPATIAALKGVWDSPELERQLTEPVSKVLGSPVRKVPSLKDTWGR